MWWWNPHSNTAFNCLKNYTNFSSPAFLINNPFIISMFTTGSYPKAATRDLANNIALLDNSDLHPKQIHLAEQAPEQPWESSSMQTKYDKTAKQCEEVTEKSLMILSIWLGFLTMFFLCFCVYNLQDCCIFTKLCEDRKRLSKEGERYFPF